MPSTPNKVTPTRCTELLMKKGELNIGKQTGPYDTDKVRERVRRWQADSTEAARAQNNDDVIVVEYEDESEDAKPSKRTPKTSPDKPRIRTDVDRRGRQSSPTKSPKTPREMDPERQAWVRKKSTPRNDLEPDLKHAGAPLKRVVSDAHWRKDRSPTKKPDATYNSEPKSYTIKRTTVYKENESSPKANKDDDGIRVTPIKEYDDGIRVTPMEKGSEMRHKERTPKSDNDQSRQGDLKQRESRHISKSAGISESKRDAEKNRDREVSRDNSNRRRRLRRRYGSPSASDAETEDRSIAQTLIPDDSISTRITHTRRRPQTAEAAAEKPIEKETPDRLSKATRTSNTPPKTTESTLPAAAPPIFGNRIEAWLTGTPDPFVAEGASLDTDENSRVSTSKRRSGRSSEGEELSKRKDSFSADARNSDGGFTDRKKTTKRYSEDSEPKRIAKESLRTIPESAPSTYDEEGSSCATSSVPPSEPLLSDVKIGKHAPGVNLRRHFPSTGKRLSTIASAETLQESIAPSEVSEQETIMPERRESSRDANGLKRRLTRHEDLMSVLSLPKADSRSVVSARSIRTNRTRMEKATLQDLWDEFATDENKYQRELRTLVDGVIPVLLSCVLSKSDSAVAAGLFGRSAANDSTITRPIVDMGVALERLKAHHRRVPRSDNSALLAWAQGAVRIYSDYLKAWRMGFQDVVVNLAPADASVSNGWDDGLPRNQDGDLVNGDGERVDVAFLLKRPLVRLKYLAKTFKGINFLAPSAVAGTMADKYQELVTEARRRSNEERGRLEDEAAANIDPNRARDLQSLALLTGVSIDATRCVRARDYFDMNLIHSSGQQLDCKIEILIRDDAPERGTSGDILICEISDTGRWLLFPPVRQDSVSARAGKGPGDIVMMIRGRSSGGKEWHELLSLHANDEPTGPEWVEMLGSSPVPPSLARRSSFLTKSQRPSSRHSQGDKSPAASDSTQKSKNSTLREIEIPIGEGPRSSSRSLASGHSETEIPTSASESVRPSSSSSSYGRLQKKPVPSSPKDAQKGFAMPSSPLRESMSVLDEMPQSMVSADSSSLKRSKATRHKSSPPISPSSSRSSLQFPAESRARSHPDRPTHTFSRSETGTTLSSYSSQSTLSRSNKDYSVWMPPSVIPSDDSESDDDDTGYLPPVSPVRPQLHRRVSSVPNLDPPRASKLRQPSELDLPSGSPEKATRSDHIHPEHVEEPSTAPAKLQKRRQSGAGVSFDDILQSTPSKDPPTKPKRFSIPSFTPNFLKRHRRSSSPLKHEYAPSSATESSTESESIYSDDDDESITSESSDEILGDVKDIISPGMAEANPFERTTPPESLASLPNNTLSPSQSASQAPYRAVPQQVSNASKTIASIFSWSDRGAWESMHPRECAIIVTPGLIEAFDMDDAMTTGPDGSDVTSPSVRGVKPLIAFEVTPLVPLRRGTALDISIRSPPTTDSLLRASNNVMFRSRSAEECDVLYSLINVARINNPTYIALQNARGPFNESTWSATMDQRNNQRPSNGSWFHNPLRRSNTYRSKAPRPPSMVTDSSVGTMNTAFSALRRFNGNSRLFNIAKSTITSRQGSRSGTSESLSSGTSTPVVYDPTQGTTLGITNAKIRLYIRESQNKWRDMGSARLSILLPPRPPSGTPPSPRTVGMEKRILINGKTQGETLLDVTLGESCFERVARTGIAVSVWEDKASPGAIGGVGTSKASTYMIQHKTERECAYTFSLVGKLRY